MVPTVPTREIGQRAILAGPRLSRISLIIRQHRGAPRPMAEFGDNQATKLLWTKKKWDRFLSHSHCTI